MPDHNGLLHRLRRRKPALATVAFLLLSSTARAQFVPVMDAPAETHLHVIEGAQTLSQEILSGMKTLTGEIKDALGPASAIGDEVAGATKTLTNVYKTVMDPINQVVEAVRIVSDIPGQVIDTLTGGVFSGGLGGADGIGAFLKLYNLPSTLMDKYGSLKGGLGAPQINWYQGIYGLIMDPYTGKPKQLEPGQALFVSKVAPESLPKDFSKADQVRDYSQNLFYDSGTSTLPQNEQIARRDLRDTVTRGDNLNAYATAMSMLGGEANFSKAVTQVRTGKSGSSNMRTDIMYNTEAVLLNVEALLRLEKILATATMAEAARAMNADPRLSAGPPPRVTSR